MLILAILLSAVLSYLLGSFNSSILVVRLLKHKDIRDYGSHNAGLTNTLRCFGKGCAALTLVGDLAKGIIAVLLSRGICELLHTGLTAQNDVRISSAISPASSPFWDTFFRSITTSKAARAFWWAFRSFWESTGKSFSVSSSFLPLCWRSRSTFPSALSWHRSAVPL